MQPVAKKITKLAQQGFTLVELLIVVIILAILAAIVIPQFSSATVDAQESALDSNLNGLRSAIELYKAQHSGKYPGDLAATTAVCTGGTKGTGLAGTAQAMIDQLTMYSDINGGTCNISVTAEKMVLGPYLRTGVPADPVTQKGNVVGDIVIQTTGAPITVAVTTGGWKYDTKSGQIVMNSNVTDSKGKAYSAH